MSKRRFPIGAEVQLGAGTHFRVWAPDRRRVAVVIEGRTQAVALERERSGHFSGLVRGVGSGALYSFRLDDDPRLYPDPASRFQPRGPHGPSEVIDPDRFRWNDEKWRGLSIGGQVLYELHVGTFTKEGTFIAAARRLEYLRELGITAVELMPIAEFAGRFGWGYDGVDLFAPHHHYGSPEDLRALVDRAHALGLGVTLDVVYNHLGPDGNCLAQFSKSYFTTKYGNEWGDAINFDGLGSEGTRELFLTNAEFWIREYHFDGFRFDATQQIFDSSARHVLAEIVDRARNAAAPRSVILTSENEPGHAHFARPASKGGFGHDAIWNDDFHHAAIVALTGRREAYYSDYRGKPRELVSATKWGCLYQGQYYAWQKNRRGSPGLDLEPRQFVNFLENHDQVANTGLGHRLTKLTSPGRLRALTALLLLAPGTPLLFQGQEYGSSAPFVYFADHQPDLAARVSEGRRGFLTQFPSLASAEGAAALLEPHDPGSFERSALDLDEAKRPEHRAILDLHADLLEIRRRDEVISAQARIEGAELADGAFLIRWFAPGGRDRLLLVNLGAELDELHIPEPLLAPPHARRWMCRWTSQSPRYGAPGAFEPDLSTGLRLPAESAALFAADEEDER
jgi:maltooligosyltrehalose trehalohydrolase